MRSPFFFPHLSRTLLALTREATLPHPHISPHFSGLEACESLSLKYSGGRPYTNMTGCFATSSGEKGVLCAFNTNQTASVCPQQPCTVNGGVAQQICLRAGGG